MSVDNYSYFLIDTNHNLLKLLSAFIEMKLHTNKGTFVTCNEMNARFYVAQKNKVISIVMCVTGCLRLSKLCL